jgi:hypothetical protein
MRSLSLLVAALLLPAVVACGLRRGYTDEAPEVEVHLLTSPAPPVVGTAQFTLELLEPGGSGVDHALLQVRGDMTHPGMAPVEGIVGQGAQGRYPVTFKWSMAGDWVLTIDGQLPDGRRLLRTIPVQVEPAP